jgi:hypothetical protein
MSITVSGRFNKTTKDIYANDTAVDLLADTIKAALFNSSPTPDFDNNTAYGASPFATNEITGTGYTSGGVALATKTLTIVGGSLVFDSDDPSWSGATFSGARAVLIHDTTIATPVADPALWLVTFGADFAVTAGVFSIQIAAGGWYNDDGTP